jgi:hypothetical protein
MPLTPQEQEELNQLEAEFAQPSLTPEEEQELAQLENEFAEKPVEQPKSYSQMFMGEVAKGPEEIGKPLNAIIKGGLQGASGGTIDEIQAAGGALVGTAADVALGNEPSISQNYSAALENARARENLAKQENPIAYGAGEVGGLIGTGIKAAGTKAGKAINDSIRSGLLPNAKTIIGRGANLGTKATQAGAAAAASGGAYGFTTGEGGFNERMDQASEFALPGGGIGAATILVPAAGRAAVKAITPTVDEGIKEVGRLAQKYNIPLSIDQLTNSKAIKTAQKASQELPFSGQSGFRDKQVAAWNRAVTKTLGEESDRITPEFIDKRFSALGNQFNDLGKGQNYNPEILTSKVDSIVQDAVDAGASREATDGFRNFVKREVSGNLNPDGTIKGETLNKIRAKANATARNSNNFDSKTLYHNFESEIIDNLLPDAAAKKGFTELKKQYKNLLAIEPLLKSEKGGVINPVLLSNRMAAVYNRQFYRGKAGELGELARVGKQLLPELGGSDTFQKGLFAGAGYASYMNPAVAPVIAGGLAANRAAQSGINRNQAIIKRLLGTEKAKTAITPTSAATIISKSNPAIVKPAEVDKVGAMLDDLRTGRLTNINEIEKSTTFKGYIDMVMTELDEAQKGERFFREADIGGAPEVVGFKGNFPEWFTQANKEGAGLSRKYIQDVVAKAKRGEKLASKEKSTFDTIKTKAQEYMQADSYDLERVLADYGLDVKAMSNKDIKAALKEIESAESSDIPF